MPLVRSFFSNSIEIHWILENLFELENGSSETHLRMWSFVLRFSVSFLLLLLPELLLFYDKLIRFNASSIQGNQNCSKAQGFEIRSKLELGILEFDIQIIRISIFQLRFGKNCCRIE